MTRFLKMVLIIGFSIIQVHAEECITSNTGIFKPSEYCILSKTPIITKIRRTDICSTSWLMTGSQTFDLKKFDSTEPEIFIAQTSRISSLCIKVDQSNTNELIETVVKYITEEVTACGLDKLNPCLIESN